jgi:short-subunit dehydrogenase
MSREERLAVVTGASGGIGRAIAAALASEGFGLVLAARDPARLAEAGQGLAGEGGSPRVVAVDLRSDEGIRALVDAVNPLGRVDVLVHAAGALRLGNIAATGWDDLDELYRVNVRAPYLLTKALLPLLVRGSGQIVFVNSSAALRAGTDNGPYAATKAALASLAGSIRDHVNPMGVRVLSLYPGRTATRMQEQVKTFERKAYDGSTLLQPGDVAAVVMRALLLPMTAEVTDIMVRPMTKP